MLWLQMCFNLQFHNNFKNTLYWPLSLKFKPRTSKTEWRRLRSAVKILLWRTFRWRGSNKSHIIIVLSKNVNSLLIIEEPQDLLSSYRTITRHITYNSISIIFTYINIIKTAVDFNMFICKRLKLILGGGGGLAKIGVGFKGFFKNISCARIKPKIKVGCEFGQNRVQWFGHYRWSKTSGHTDRLSQKNTYRYLSSGDPKRIFPTKLKIDFL